MSKFYRQKTGKEMNPSRTEKIRNLLKQPGNIDQSGNIIYTTEQSHKDLCDVNKIIKKYDKTGLISHVQKIEAKYGNLSGADFQQMQNKIAGAISMFNALPSEIRGTFDNSPATFLNFMDNPDNRNKAIEMGLIRGDWTPETDGLGEHVLAGKNITITPADNDTKIPPKKAE